MQSLEFSVEKYFGLPGVRIFIRFRFIVCSNLQRFRVDKYSQNTITQRKIGHQGSPFPEICQQSLSQISIVVMGIH